MRSPAIAAATRQGRDRNGLGAKPRRAAAQPHRPNPLKTHITTGTHHAPTENHRSVPYLSPAELADATGDYAAIGLSKGQRKRNNRALLKAGALILPHEEARLVTPARTYADGVWEAFDSRIREALARCEESERRTIAWITGRSDQ